MESKKCPKCGKQDYEKIGGTGVVNAVSEDNISVPTSENYRCNNCDEIFK